MSGLHAAASAMLPVMRSPQPSLRIDGPRPPSGSGFDVGRIVPTQRATVVIGTSSPLLLCGLESLLLATTDLHLEGTAQTLHALLRLCTEMGDGVALVDPCIGPPAVRETIGAIRAAAPAVRVVLVTDAHQPHRLREAVKAGACGLVGKTAEADEICSAVRAAVGGRRYVAVAIATHLAAALTLEELTCREMEVLGLLSKGDCNKAIARVLDVTVGTVKTHVRAIMGKLESSSRTEAVRKAYQLGLVCLDN